MIRAVTDEADLELCTRICSAVEDVAPTAEQMRAVQDRLLLDPDGGYDLVKGGKKAGQAIRDDYREHRYHQPSDEWRADWDLSGPVEDLKALYQVGETLANSTQWPNWYRGNEFRAIRDKEMK